MAADDPCSVADGGAKRLSDFVVDPDSSLRRLTLPGFPLLPRRLSPLPPAALRRRKRAPERKSAFLPTTFTQTPSTTTNCYNVQPAKIRIVSTFFFTTCQFLYPNSNHYFLKIVYLIENDDHCVKSQRVSYIVTLQTVVTTGLRCSYTFIIISMENFGIEHVFSNLFFYKKRINNYLIDKLFRLYLSIFFCMKVITRF